ncbi:hypothetical protein AB0C51_16935 [Streptomyces pathocidini]|uniref:Metallothionein n=1 Tax=Streptomyces pathocidini TaxID=1650571 RepID=A0ABW7UWZ7_9ACTN|nr:hypothetical protein [Streptomyces pathocidini]
MADSPSTPPTRDQQTLDRPPHLAEAPTPLLAACGCGAGCGCGCQSGGPCQCGGCCG